MSYNTNTWEREYLNLCHEVVAYGYKADSRAGATRSLPGTMLKITLDQGFPLLTTRKMYPAGVIGELCGFVRGATGLATYEKFGCNYWHDNAAEWAPNKGKPESEWQIGRIYGTQWVDWRPSGEPQSTLNQLSAVITTLKTDPLGRRHIVTAWNPAELDLGVLPPCHIMFQFYVREGGLHCMVYMRSVDLCVGLPSDIALYALLTSIIAKDTGLSPMSLTFFFGDCHVYENHVEVFKTQRFLKPGPSPKLVLTPEATTFNLVPDMVSIENYNPGLAIKYPFNK